MSWQQAQTTIEFLVAFSIVILLFTCLSLLLYQKVIQTAEIKTDIAGKRLSQSLAHSINQIHVAGEGFSTTVSLPEKIAQHEYQIKFYPQEPTVFLSTKKQTWSAPLFTSEINCSLDRCTMDTGLIILAVNATLDITLLNADNRIYLME